ncbi:MAG: porin [Phycisphaerales bacterium]|jgi:hypothetical protein|nr:porin [Phycisphaerales bacterium]
MDQRSWQWIAIATLVCSASPRVGAQPPTQSQLDDLVQQLDRVEAINAEVKLELDTARSELSDNWLDEARASQIASLVQDVLNEADTRTNLRGDGFMMGWSNGFFLASADGRHRLNVSGMMQTRYLGSWIGKPSNPTIPEFQSGFDIPRVRFNIDGKIPYANMEYFIQTGWGRLDPDNMTDTDDVVGVRLWEAWAKFKIADDLSLKIGQFKIPFTRETLVDASNQLAIEKSLIDHRMGLEISTGVEFIWANRDRRFFVAYTNGSGAMLWSTPFMFDEPTAMPPWAAVNRDTSYSCTLRHEWKLSGGWEQCNQFTSPPGSGKGLLLGIAGHRQNLERDDTGTSGGFVDGSMWGVTADASYFFDGASFFVAGTFHRVKDFNQFAPQDLNWMGVVAQGGTYISNRTELFGRFEAGGISNGALGGEAVQIMTVGLNHYLDGQDLKVSADVGFSFGEVPGTMENSLAGWRTDTEVRDQVVVRTQLQVMF